MSNPSIQNRKYCFFVLRRQHRVLNPPPAEYSLPASFQKFMLRILSLSNQLNEMYLETFTTKERRYYSNNVPVCIEIRNEIAIKDR